MKKLLLLALFGLAALPAQAQLVYTSDIEARVEIVSTITIANPYDLDFDRVPLGASKTLDPKSDPLDNSGSAESVGQFTISGGVAGAPIALTVVPPVAFTHVGSGLPSIGVIYTMGTQGIAFNSTDDQANATYSATPALTDLTAVPDSGEIYLWIGGSITTTALSQLGEHLGTYTLDVTYF